MSMNIQNAFNSLGRSGPVPGLGGAFGEDSFSSDSGEGQDFAALMRDMPPHKAPAPEPRKRGEASEKADPSSRTESKSDAQNSSAARPANRKAETSRVERTGKAVEEKQETKPDEKPAAEGVAKQGVPPVAAPVAQAASENVPVDVKTDAKDRAAPAITVAKATPEPLASSKGKAKASTDSKAVPVEIDANAASTQPKEAKPTKVDTAKVSEPSATVQPEAKANTSGKKPMSLSGDTVPAHTAETKSDVKVPLQKVEKAESQAATKAGTKAGEATALLQIADGQPQTKAQTKAQMPSDAPLTGFFGQRLGQSAQSGKNGAGVTANGQAGATAPTSGAAILAPQGKAAAGLDLTTEQVPNPAAVAARTALAQGTEAPLPAPNRTAEVAQVSTLALAAAQSSGNSAGEGADTTGGHRGDAAPLGSGVFGDGEAEVGENSQSVRFASRLDSAANIAAASSSAPATAPATVTAPTSLNLGGVLGQQVVDLGVSGQWINDIAREIATVSTNAGHGRFQIASQTMGAVRVEITPGAQGSNVLMTVDNEMAQAALMNDRQRLVQDAQLASVRIGDFRVDRVASLSQAQSGDMSNGQQGQNQSNNGQNTQGTSQNAMGQNTGQGGGQNSRQDMGGLADNGQNGGNPKAPFTQSVINDAETRDATLPSSGRGGDTARYA